MGMSMHQDDRVAELKDAARRFGEAWANGDIAVLDALLSPTYTHTDVFGDFLKRADWLAYVQKRAGRASQISFRDVDIRMFGDVAVVTGINEVRGGGALSPTDQQDLLLRFTQVWVWRDGRWLREAFQATPVISGRGS